MALKDKLQGAKTTISDAASDAAHKVAEQPKRAGNAVGLKLKKTGDLIEQKYDHSKTKKAVDGAAHVAKGIKDFANSGDKKKFLADKAQEKLKAAPGALGKTGSKLGKSIAKKAKQYESVKKTIDGISKAKDVIAVVGKPVLIALGIILILYAVIVCIIGVAQGVSPTPHYYCDLDANRTIRSSAIYKQYCTQHDVTWSVDNIDGHYIVQDGSGPASACAMANMLLRFYSIESQNDEFGSTNVYKYLWQADGMYTNEGITLGEKNATAGVSRSIRQMLNHFNTTTVNTDESDPNMPNGSREFAALHGKSNYTMSNWGYLRDEFIDIDNYRQARDFYTDQTDNKKWVWDLSLDNSAPGTSWELDNWDMSVRMNVTRFNVEQMTIPNTENGYQIFKDRLIGVLTTKTSDWEEYFKGSAGAMIKYTKVGGGTSQEHTILVTKFVPTGQNYGQWYGVDSSLGTCGGWEGPMDGTGRFVKNDTAINALLNSADGTYNDGTYTYTLDKIGYCTKPIFGLF